MALMTRGWLMGDRIDDSEERYLRHLVGIVEYYRAQVAPGQKQPSEEELGRLAGLSRSSMNAFLNAKAWPHPARLWRLWRALNVPLVALAPPMSEPEILPVLDLLLQVPVEYRTAIRLNLEAFLKAMHGKPSPCA